MGLAAGQARLLTITGRKSDCEFESMRLSHQKIAVARELADLSNEYQNSLTKTKLIYDYYGTGDTNTPLTYSTLMTASKLNDYKPTLVTDALGRVALTSEYAVAAAAAGIPQEGLGCLPSEIVRNQFVQALAAPTVGLITQDMADKITAIPYNQGAGYGNGSVALTLTEDVTYSKLCEMISDSGLTVSGTITSEMSSFRKAGYAYYENGEQKEYIDTRVTIYQDPDKDTTNTDVSYDLGKLLSGDADAYFWVLQKEHLNEKSVAYINEFIDNLLGQTHDILSEYLGIDNASSLALEYALKETRESILLVQEDEASDTNKYVELNGSKYFKDLYLYTDSDYLITQNGSGHDGLGLSEISGADSSVGWAVNWGSRSGTFKMKDRRCRAQISVGNILQAYVTNFLDAMNGLNATDLYGNELYSVNEQVDQSNLVSSSDMFTIYTGVEVTSDDLAVATFYDTLLNKICMDGWTENDQVEDPEYLQQMLQNGMLYISKAKDDGYYYQGNFSIDTYIKEIDDTQYIAEAEAKYNTEKAKLNSKEETLDMKMKNLDTEMSALTTEYDTVKNTISKNIEKSFKRYSA